MIKLIIFDAGDVLYKVPSHEDIRKALKKFFSRYEFFDIEKSDRIWFKIPKW